MEVHFFRSCVYAPFELRLVELLYSCPLRNLWMTISHSHGGHQRREISCDIRCSQVTTSPLKVSKISTREENERGILKFMREYIRKVSLALIRTYVKEIETRGRLISNSDSELISLISYINSGDELLIDYTNSQTGNGNYIEKFEAAATTLGKYGIRCSFEMQFSPRADGWFSNSKITCFLSDTVCVACRYPEINNNFSLRVTSGKSRTDLVKQVLVVYESIRNNYSLTISKHPYDDE